MVKLIYVGDNKGFYEASSFKKFLIKSFELVLGDPNSIGEVSMTANKDNVTLTYNKKISSCPDNVNIRLFGKEEDTSKVEEIISKAAEDYVKEN